MSNSIRLLLCAIMSTVAPAARAQVAATKADTIMQSVEKLRTGHRLRVAADGGRIEGPLQFRFADGFSITADREPHRFQPAMIDTLWLRSHHAKDGMLIGGFTGGAVGAVLLSSLVAQGDSRALAVGVGFIVGAIPSGLMGGMVGAFFPKWDLTYPK